MFLSALNQEEKILFLEMAMNLAIANNVVDETEVLMLDQYCKEMEITSFDKSQIHTVEEIIDAFKGASETSKRIAVLELIGLSYSDGEFDKIEDSALRDFATGIGLAEETYEQLSSDINNYVSVANAIQEHVFPGSL